MTYLELTSPGVYFSNQSNIIVVKVKEDSGKSLRVCTATPGSLESTIEFLSREYKATSLVDKRFLPVDVAPPDEAGSL